MSATKELRPLLVTVDWPHHANGGYGALTRFLPGQIVNYPSLRHEDGASIAKAALDVILFNANIRRAISSTPMMHLLYGDTMIVPATSRFRRTALVCTIHLPLTGVARQRLVDRVRGSVLDRSDAIIVLSSEEAEAAAARVPDASVRFIPHGIDTGAYRVPFLKSGRPTFVAVGTNLRDWSSLGDILSVVVREHPDWQVRLVGMPDDRTAPWRRYPSVEVCNRLSFHDYREAISSSWAMLLPLRAATANNALLEAHALGTVVIGSSLPGVRDYGCTTTRYFDTPDEALSIMTTVASSTTAGLQRWSAESVEAAQRFDWTTIADMTWDLYQQFSPGLPVLPLASSGESAT